MLGSQQFMVHLLFHYLGNIIFEEARRLLLHYWVVHPLVVVRTQFPHLYININ